MPACVSATPAIGAAAHPAITFGATGTSVSSTKPASTFAAIDFHALSGVDRRRSRFTVSRPIELRSCMRSVPELIVTLRTRNGDPKSGSAAVLAFLRRADMTD